MELDTGREALNTHAATQTVKVEGLTASTATTASTPAAIRVDLEKGVIVCAPKVEAKAAVDDFALGALATDKAQGHLLYAYYSPAADTFVIDSIGGTVIDFSGSEVPTFPTLEDVRAALPAGVEDRMVVVLGGVIAENDGGTVAVKWDISQRAYGVRSATKFTANSALDTLE